MSQIGRPGRDYMGLVSSSRSMPKPTNGEVILRCYFRERMRMADIAREVGVSHAFVSKTVAGAKSRILSAWAASKPKRGRPKKKT